MIKALIIDDEENGRETFISLIKRYCPEIDLAGEADGVKSGLESITRHQPDVVFLDIEMPDGTGFDLLSQIDYVNFEVIFVSAYDKYAIKAFQFSAVDYLLKPVSPELLKQSVKKLKTSVDVLDLKRKIDTLLGNVKKPNKIVLPTSEGIHIVKVENIVRCNADGYYTVFHLNDSSKITVSKTLKEYSETLESLNFFRTHQSHLINLDFVERFVNTEGGYVVMQNSDQVAVSRRKKKQLMEILIG